MSFLKTNENRSPARIITSRFAVTDNNSHISVPLGFVNPEGDADKDLSRRNGESAKTDQQGVDEAEAVLPQ